MQRSGNRKSYLLQYAADVKLESKEWQSFFTRIWNH